jgi:Uma2 family endonuclease
MSAMTMQIPRGEHVPTADDRVVMYGVSWDAYETMLDLRGERSTPRMAYLDGALELMTTSEDHERIKCMVSRMLEAYMLRVGVLFGGYGSWTMRKQLADAGIEADQCYRLGPDQTRGRWPDLAIEVVWTSGGIDKLEAYRRIGVREVWFWKDEQIHVYVLRDSAYVEQPTSDLVPGLDLALVGALVERPTINDAVRELLAALAT